MSQAQDDDDDGVISSTWKSFADLEPAYSPELGTV